MKIKLLKTIAIGNGTQNHFEYDTQNRLTKIKHCRDGDVIATIVFTYIDDKLVRVVSNDKYTTNFVHSGNIITATDARGGVSTYILDTNGNLAKWKWTDYSEEDVMDFVYDSAGNAIKSTLFSQGSKVTDIRQYDNKIAPFRYCKAPKWYLAYNYRTISGFQNNHISSVGDNGISAVFTYEYDGDGFPTKRTSKNNYGGVQIETFTYITR